MERYSIGIDLGTSSVKAVLFSEKRGIAFKASEKFEYESSRLPSGSKMWQKVLSEVFEVPITVTYGAYSGAVGAAMYTLKAE